MTSVAQHHLTDNGGNGHSLDATADAQRDEWRALLGPVVAYYPRLTLFLEDLLPAGTRGLLATSIVLSQLLYWHGKGHNGEWTYKRDSELMDETGVTYEELKRAKKLLKSTRLVAIEYHGVPPIPWYRIDAKNFVSLLRRGCGTRKWEGR